MTGFIIYDILRLLYEVFLIIIYLFSRWRYVIKGILEVNVKPSLHMWSWKHIKCHRQQIKQCKELYKTKITSKKPAETLLKKLEVNGTTWKTAFSQLLWIVYWFYISISVCVQEQGIVEYQVIERRIYVFIH